MYTIFCVLECEPTYIKVTQMTEVLRTLIRISNMNEDNWVTCVMTPKGTMIACCADFKESKAL